MCHKKHLRNEKKQPARLDGNQSRRRNDPRLNRAGSTDQSLLQE